MTGLNERARAYRAGLHRVAIKQDNPWQGAGMKAIWNGTVVADSNDTVVVEGNHYFPASAVDKKYLLASNTKTMCSWKGQASYYTLFVEGDANPDAVWFYPEPKEAAAEIAGRLAFWKGVRVVE